MGLALGYGSGYQFKRRIVITEGSKYISAATADGYSGGSATCSQEFFTSLSAVSTNGFADALAYINAATADSYTGGSVYCSELFFLELDSMSTLFFLISNNQWSDEGVWSDNVNWID